MIENPEKNGKSKYADILPLPHPESKKHPRTPRSARAAQFAPFAALTGYEDAIAKTQKQAVKRQEEGYYVPFDENNP